jgi:hypothetical protein
MRLQIYLSPAMVFKSTLANELLLLQMTLQATTCV